MRARLVKLQVVDREGVASDGQPLHGQLQSGPASGGSEHHPALDRREERRDHDECGRHDHPGNNDEQTPDNFHG